MPMPPPIKNDLLRFIVGAFALAIGVVMLPFIWRGL